MSESSNSTPSGRRAVNFRMGHGGVEWLDRIARETGVRRSDVIRAALKMGAGQERALKVIIASQSQDVTG